MGVIDKISLNLSTRLGDRLNKDEEEKAVLNYGLFMIIHTFIGIIITILVGLITGMIIEISLITITSALFKRYTGGVHASTPEICLIIGIILSLILSMVCRFISINTDINNIALIGIIIIVFSYYMIYFRHRKFLMGTPEHLLMQPVLIQGLLLLKDLISLQSSSS